MKLGKKEVEQVMSTNKAKSIHSSRMSSRAASRLGSAFSSRKGSLDMADETMNKEEEK